MGVRRAHTKSTSGCTHRLTIGEKVITRRFHNPPQFDDQVQGDLIRQYWREGGTVSPIGPITGGVAVVDKDLDLLEPRPAAGDPNVRWLVVTNGEARVVERYLYQHARLVESFDFASSVHRYPSHLVVVFATREDVDYLANYQAERLRSGLMGTTVHTTFKEAIAALPKD